MHIDLILYHEVKFYIVKLFMFYKIYLLLYFDVKTIASQKNGILVLLTHTCIVDMPKSINTVKCHYHMASRLGVK